MKKNEEKKIDIVILFTVILLCAIGIIMIFSSSFVYSKKIFNDSTYFVKKQIVFFIIGFILMVCTINIDYRFYKKYYKWFYGLGLFLLILVFVPGIRHSGGGATRWLKLYFFSFQPSEFAKLAFLIFMAALLEELSIENNPSYGKYVVGISVFFYAVYAFFIYLQPNMSTAILLGIILFVMLFIGNIRMIPILMLTSVFMLSGIFFAIQRPYRLKRLIAFFNPNRDPTGITYQITQSLIAIGSGGVLGLGLGKSIQKSGYLPAQHTDFIFSIIAEELGFVGCLLIISLFMILLFRGFSIANNATDYFGQYLAAGLTMTIVFQAFINVSVVLSLIPTTGLPLPFISAGGSSLLMNMVEIGILLNISKHARTQKAEGKIGVLWQRKMV